MTELEKQEKEFKEKTDELQESRDSLAIMKRIEDLEQRTGTTNIAEELNALDKMQNTLANIQDNAMKWIYELKQRMNNLEDQLAPQGGSAHTPQQISASDYLAMVESFMKREDLLNQTLFKLQSQQVNALATQLTELKAFLYEYANKMSESQAPKEAPEEASKEEE
jgi:hypothetical protein